MDYVYTKKIEPYYKAIGHPVPPRSSYDNTDKLPIPELQYDKPSATDFFGVGVASGAAKLIGPVGLALKMQYAFSQALADVSGSPALHRMANKDAEVLGAYGKFNKAINKPMDDWFETYSTDATIGQHIAHGGGELLGMAPAFMAAGGVLRSGLGLEQLASGTASVPVALSNAPTLIRGIVASRLLQTSLYSAVDGAVSANVLNESADAPDWAVFGAALPVGFKALTKPFTYLWAKGGSGAISEVLSKSRGLALLSKEARPAPSSPEDALASLQATQLDTVANEMHGKTFSELSGKEQQGVLDKASKSIIEAVTNPEPGDIAELSSAEHDALSSVSPLAQQSRTELDGLLKGLGQPTTGDIVKEKAATSTSKANFANEVKNETVPETPATLSAQVEAVKAGTKPAILLPSGTTLPKGANTEGLKAHKFKDGRTVIWNPSSGLNLGKIKEQALLNKLESILEYPTTKEEAVAAIKDGEVPVAIKASDPITGNEVSTTIATTSNAIEGLETTKKHFPDAKVEVVPASAVKDIIEARIKGNLYHHINNVYAQLQSLALQGKPIAFTKEQILRLKQAKQDAIMAGMSVEDVEAIVNQLKARGESAIEKTKEFAAKNATFGGEGIEKAKSSITQKVTSGVKPKNWGQTVKAEQGDTALDQSEYQKILLANNFTSSKEITSQEDAEMLRRQILNRHISTEDWYKQKDGTYSNKPNDTEATRVNPKAIFDADTAYNPPFIKAVRAEFPEITTENAVEAYKQMLEKVGNDEPKVLEWLKSHGYDAIKLGRKGRGEGVQLEILNPNIVRSPSQEATDALIGTAKALGFPKEVTDAADVAAKKVEKVLEPVRPKARTFDASGKEIKSGETPTIEKALTDTGKVKLGVDVDRMWEIMGGSLYKNRSSKTVVKELLQNAFDAVRGVKGGKVTVSMLRNNSEVAYVVEDNGVGMSKQELESVFTNLGESGKGNDISASGGFGLAKAAIFMIPDELSVTSISVGKDGNKYMNRFITNPGEVAKGFEIKTSQVNGDVPTGTKILTNFKSADDYWQTKSFAMGMGKSIALPGEYEVREGYMYGRDFFEHEPNFKNDKNFDLLTQTSGNEDRLNVLASDENLGSKLEIFETTEKRPLDRGNSYSIPVEINNNGIFQFEHHVPTNAAELAGVPKRLLLNVKAKVSETNIEYPFSANREDLKDSIKQFINKTVMREIIEPAVNRAAEELGRLYDGLPQIIPGVTVYDAGKRFTAEEMDTLAKNPAVIQIARTIKNVTTEALNILGEPGLNNVLNYPEKEPLGSGIKRIGLVFSDAVHGVMIPRPGAKGQGATERTILINPFSSHFPGDIESISSLIWHTIKHEIVHDKIGGHNESFTTVEANISQYLGARTETQFLKRIKEALGDADDSQRVRPEFNDALQLYQESRGRAEREKDVFRSEKLDK
jgi:hypothetical protein